MGSPTTQSSMRRAANGAASSDALPALMNVVGRSGAEPTRAFSTLYRKHREFLCQVFQPAANPQSTYPPERPADFVRQRYVAAPATHQLLTRELWTLIRDLDSGGRRVNGKRLYDHQLAHLIWVASSLVDGRSSPTSFFIEGAPGTGKTLTLGMLMQACVRMQMRQHLEGKIAYCTAKPYHLSDKVRGSGMGHRRVLRAPPYAASPKDINRRRLALRKIDAECIDRLFPKKRWNELFENRPATEAEARQLVEEHLSHYEVEVRDQDEILLGHIAKILACLATTVRGPSGAMEVVSLQSPPGDDLQLEAHTGDAAFAIPTDYAVYARENIGVSTASRSDADVVLEPALVFTSARQVEKSQEELHRHVRVILCDEAQRREPLAFQEPVVSSGAVGMPLVFAAGSRWYGKRWDRRSPSHSYPESIRRGILPDLGVRLFPSANAAHYPAETQQALDQLIKVYFASISCFDDLKLPQPTDVNTLVVMHGRLVDPMVMRLREEFAKRDRAAEVRPFHGNEEDREVLQLWFDSERDGPNILVSSAAVIKESVDLRTIRHLVIGTRVSADALYHLIGRLAHSRAMASKDDRVLLSLQQFANSNLRATPFVALDHGQEFAEEGFNWINGHVLISERGFRRDQKRLAPQAHRRDAIKVPPATRRKRSMAPAIKMAGGTSLLPNRAGHLRNIPADAFAISSGASRLARVPVVEEEYDPKKGPPSRTLARQWAAECDGAGIFDTYHSIMLAVEEAHREGRCPRQALEQKIARLRERSSEIGGTR